MITYKTQTFGCFSMPAVGTTFSSFLDSLVAEVDAMLAASCLCIPMSSDPKRSKSESWNVRLECGKKQEDVKNLNNENQERI